MKIFITGASSFTGYWIAGSLAERGHHVVANFSNAADEYSDVRRMRLDGLRSVVDCRFEVSFSSDSFGALVAAEKPDILCLHGAEVTNYRSWNFDPIEAARRNTYGIRNLFETLADCGGSAIATGSVFEPFEGVGDPDCRAFNPYGLSKHLSFEVFRIEDERAGVALSKFVIPNPFGILEDPRFTNYLVSEWAKGSVPKVSTPDYVRDNIHVDLLAQCYAALVDLTVEGRGVRMRPSGYIESQGQFATRFAAAMGQAWGRELSVEFANQTEFPEPRIRVNDMPGTVLAPNWREAPSWRAIADYYADRIRPNC